MDITTLSTLNHRIYRLRTEPFRAIDLWLQSFQHIMEDHLDNYLVELQTRKNNQLVEFALE